MPNYLLLIALFVLLPACLESSSVVTQDSLDQEISSVFIDASNEPNQVLDRSVVDQGSEASTRDMLLEDMSTIDMANIDEDGDGYPASVDCNDTNELIFPNATESCNGIDDDCDDLIDEGESLEGSPIWYLDQDQDQFGNEEQFLQSCMQPPNHVLRSGDCDDGNDQINPEQAEQCDGIDNNCSGVIDDGVINDGAGCLDPGAPALPPQVNVAQLTIRNGNNAGDDGNLEFELSSGRARLSRSLNNVSWDDHMRHTVDVYTMNLREDVISYNDLVGGYARLNYDDSDAWAIACTQLSVDGLVISCEQYNSPITLDAGARESLTLSLSNPLPSESLPCTCYDQYLSHGPRLGAVGPNHIRIWGRTDARRKVIIKVGESLENTQTIAYRYPAPENDHTFEVDIYGLNPSTTYHYVIDVAGQMTNGQFTTAPLNGAQGSYKFAVGSCAKTVPHRHPEQPIFGAIINAQPDMMFMLGDNVYFDSLSNGDAPDLGAMRSYYRDAIQRSTSWSAPHYPGSSVYDPQDPAVRPSTLSRARWWGTFGRNQRADFVASTPTIAIWDDHDFYSNNADAFYDDSGTRKPWTYDSIKVFKEYWPNPDGGLSPDQINEMGIYFKQSWGDIDIFGLDTRFHRDDTREHMLGRAQMDWIKRELSASEATFKFVLSGSIFAGGTNDHEKWPHFEADQNELFNHIWNQGIGGVVLMSGDIHISSVLEHRNPNRSSDPYIIYEIISSGLANYGPSNPNSDDYGSIIQMRYMPPYTYDRRKTTVFALVETDSTLPDPTLSVQFIDENGNSACADCPFIIQRSALDPQP